MQLTLKLINILPLQSGTGKNGVWKKQDIIFETQDQYPKKICISFWGDKLNGIFLNESEIYTLDFDVESREFNGKWYTDVKAWKIIKEIANSSANSVSPISTKSNAEKMAAWDKKEDDDNLPF